MSNELQSLIDQERNQMGWAAVMKSAQLEEESLVGLRDAIRDMIEDNDSVQHVPTVEAMYEHWKRMQSEHQYAQHIYDIHMSNKESE